MKNKIQYIPHVGIFTNNLRRLYNFYTKKLGFKQEKNTVIPREIMAKIFGISCDCKLIRLVNNNAKVEMFSSDSAFFKRKLNWQMSYNHSSFIVRDRVKFCENLSRKGLPIIKIKRNSHFTYFIKDPDGNRIEILD